jgi:hypothetical protein
MAMEAYRERFRDMWYASGPGAWPLLFADVEEARRTVRSADEEGAFVDPDALERARRVVRAAVHPDTGKVIPLPFRMAAHVPMNTIILMGLLSSHGIVGTTAWQVRARATRGEGGLGLF